MDFTHLSLQASLRDIHGLDAAPWWPPAPGWWLVLSCVIAVVLLLWWGYRTWRLRRDQWRRDASAQLLILRKGLQGKEPKAVASELSELLRRIAMARCSRRECAGLVADQWLDWLHRNDPRGFDWNERGRLLLELPYAQRVEEANVGELRQLINAALQWVAAGDLPPCATRDADKGRQAAGTDLVEGMQSAHV